MERKPEESLREAVRQGDRERVVRLLEGGAQVDARDEEGATALQVAAMHGDVALTRLLLDRGADTGARDADGRTPLHRAGTLEGADPTARDEGGNTPLDWAQLQDDEKMSDLLQGRGRV